MSQVPLPVGFVCLGEEMKGSGPRSPECFEYFISHLLRMKCPIPPPLKEVDGYAGFAWPGRNEMQFRDPRRHLVSQTPPTPSPPFVPPTM